MAMNLSQGGGSSWNATPGQHKGKNTSKHQDQSEIVPKASPKLHRSLEVKTTADALNVIAQNKSFEWLSKRSDNNNDQYSPVVNLQNEDNRLATFVGHWPDDAVVSSTELAKAGMYYTGPGDRVQCAYCRGGLLNWEKGDTAVGEHIRHFPNCKYIQQVMAGLVNTPPTHGSHHTGDSDSKHKASISIVKDMGYSDDVISSAMEKLTCSDTEVTVDSLLDAVYDLESEEEDATSTLAKSQTKDNDQQESHSTEIKGEKRDSLSDVHELEKENSILKGKTLCKVCMDAELSILFLPCRHLVCCKTCGNMVKHCPICRTFIKGTVDAFLA